MAAALSQLQSEGTGPAEHSWSEASPCKYTPTDVVISRYATYKNQRDIGKLAVALAKFTYFGEDVLRKSTLTGSRNKDTVPLDPNKLKSLSKDIRGVFPSDMSPQEFTRIWARCVASLADLMKRLRQNYACQNAGRK